MSTANLKFTGTSTSVFSVDDTEVKYGEAAHIESKNYVLAFDKSSVGTLTFDSGVRGEISLDSVTVGSDQNINVSVETIVADDTTYSLSFDQDKDKTLNDRVKNLKLGGGKDNVTITQAGTTVSLGDGNDYVSVSTTGDNVILNLGEGKDTVDLANGLASVEVTDYNFADGDVITVKTGSVDYKGDGKFVVGSKVSVDAAKGDGYYGLQVNDNDYIAAVDGNVSFTQTDKNAVIVYAADGAEVKNLDLTFNEGEATVDFADHKKLENVNIVAGKSSVTVNVDKEAALTYTINKKGAAGASISRLDDNDTLVISDGAFSKVTVEHFNTGTAFKYGTTGVVSVGNEAGMFNIKDNAGAEGLVSFGNENVAYDADAAYYIGTGDAMATIVASDDDKDVVIDLSDKNKHRNIGTVHLGANGGIVVGAGDAATTIDAANVDEGVTTNIYGGGKSDDTIVLGKGNDVVWFNHDDGTDSVASFSAENDVLFFYKDLTDLSALKFDGTVGDSVVGVSFGKTSVNVSAVDHDNDNLTIRLSDGTDKKVAVALGNTNKIVATTDTDLVYANAAAAKKDPTGLVEYKDVDSAFVIDLNDASKYVNVVDANLSTATGDITIVGNGKYASKISVGSGVNNVYGGAGTSDTITLASQDGTDTIWFDAKAGVDTVANFDVENDKVFLWSGVTDAKTIVGTLKNDGTNTTLQFATDNKLVLNGVNGKVSIVDSNNNSYVANVSKSDKVEISSDAQLYAANGKKATAEVSADYSSDELLVINLQNEFDNMSFAENIVNLDASKSSAKVIVKGGADGAVIAGGQTMNALYGGTSGSQTLVGNKDAVDAFWFGTGDGNDKATDASSDDIVYLHNVTDISQVSITINNSASSNLTVSVGDSKLTVSAATGTANELLEGGFQFWLKDFTGAGQQYTYDVASKSFKQKA